MRLRSSSSSKRACAGAERRSDSAGSGARRSRSSGSWGRFPGGNFFQLQQRGFLQGHEHFHYLLGAKYFPELGYTRLYPCTAVADANVLGRARLRGRMIRDLESNRVVPIRHAIDHPERCTSHFEPERWREFQQDVAWFRARIPRADWRWLVIDHGFNAPPAWGVLGISVANLLGVSDRSVVLAARIDPVLQLILWVAVAWAFGWRVLCVALVVWGTNGLGEFRFVGGAFLRQDWLCAAVVGLCLLRREKHLAAGALLATSALLRIFPAFLILALGMKTLSEMWKARSLRPPTAHLRFATGCLLAVLVVVPLSGATSGFDSWPSFIRNIRMHQDTPLVNYVGLRTIASYDAANPIPSDFSRQEDERWADRREEMLGENAWMVVLGILLYVALLARAAGRSPDWVVAALGVGGVFVFLEITAYYYSMLIALALLHERDVVAGAALCAFSALSLLLSSTGASSAQTYIHMATSCAIAVLVLVVTWRSGKLPRAAREVAR